MQGNILVYMAHTKNILSVAGENGLLWKKIVIC